MDCVAECSVIYTLAEPPAQCTTPPYSKFGNSDRAVSDFLINDLWVFVWPHQRVLRKLDFMELNISTSLLQYKLLRLFYQNIVIGFSGKYLKVNL